MKNRGIKQIIFSVTVTIGILSMGCTIQKTTNKLSQKPNVIFVFADEWRAQATGFNGDTNVAAPTLDKLAAKSIVFSTAISNMPVCTPYRASLLTGQYPLTNGVFMNDVRLSPEANTMGKIYKKAGYNTAYIGKWHLDGQCRSCYIPPERRQGFDYWKVLECTHNYNNSPYFANNDTIPSKWPGYDAYYQTLDAQNYIEKHANDKKPFLLVLSWGPPHNPYQTAPEKYKKKYENKNLHLRQNVPPKYKEKALFDLKGYYSHLNALDDYLSLLLKTMDENGVANNTIFVFTADHGDMLYSHGVQKKQRPFDESILVPFVLRYPNVFGNNKKVIDMPINTPDILPTLLGLCKIAVPESIEGNDFSDYLTGRKATLKDTVATIECIQPFGEWSRAKGGKEYRGVRTRRYTYVRDMAGPWLLFDNVTDPYQMHNLVDLQGYSGLQVHLDSLLMKKLKTRNDRFMPGLTYVKKYNYPPLNSMETVPYRE